MPNQNWTAPVTAQDHFQQSEKRLAMEERRPRITKAADLLGPLSGPSAILINDSLNSATLAFNGLFIVPPGTPESPDPTKWFMGQSIAQDGIGGVQILRTFRAADYPHTEYVRGWETVVNTGGLRTYSAWEGAGAVGDELVITSFASPYTGSVTLHRIGAAVYITVALNRSSGYDDSFHTLVTVPVGYRPEVTAAPAASLVFNSTVSYQLAMATNGDLNIRESAATSAQLSWLGVYITADPAP